MESEEMVIDIIVCLAWNLAFFGLLVGPSYVL